MKKIAQFLKKQSIVTKRRRDKQDSVDPTNPLKYNQGYENEAL